MANKTFTVTEAIKAGILDVAGHANKVLGNEADGGYFFMPNDGKTVLVCVCGAGPAQLVFTAIADKYGRTESLTPTPGTSKTSIIGPFLPELWNQSDGTIKFQAGGGTGVVTDIYLAVRVGRPS